MIIFFFLQLKYVISFDFLKEKFLFQNAIHVLNVKQQYNGFSSDDPLLSTDFITALSISREGDVAIAGCAAGSVRLFNLIDGEFTEHITDHQGAVTQVALSHSYLFSLSGSKDANIKVYDNEMGEIVAEFTVRKNSQKLFFF